MNLSAQTPAPRERGESEAAGDGFGSRLKGMLRVCQHLLADLRLPVFRFEQDGFSLEIIGRRENLAHLLKIYFGSNLPGGMVGELPIGGLGRELERRRREGQPFFLSLASALCPRRLGESLLEAPNLVTQALDLPTREEDLIATLRNDSNKNDLRKIQNQPFSFEITRDPQWLDRFYEEFYRPQIARRHGDTAWVMTRRQFGDLAGQGELLLVRLDGRPVSGGINTCSGGCYHLRVFGLHQSDPELMTNGSVAAYYYFSFLQAIRRGCRVASLGRTIPYLNDGILQFKRKWNCRVGMEDRPDRRLWFSPGRLAPATLARLARNPMIVKRGPAQHGLVFADDEQAADPKAWRHRFKGMFHPGLAAMHLVLVGPAARELGEVARPVAALYGCKLTITETEPGGMPDPQTLLG